MNNLHQTILSVLCLLTIQVTSHGQVCLFKSVSTSEGHSVGIGEDNKLYSWGANAQGQLGLGFIGGQYLSPTIVNSDTDWKKAISRILSVTIALKQNGTLWFMGPAYNGFPYNTFGPYTSPTQFANEHIWKDFSVGYNMILAIKDDNTLWAMGGGFNYAPALGLGTMIPVLAVTQVGLDDDWKKVSCGMAGHTLALKSNGTIWAWGYNNVGQLGNGTSGQGNLSTIPIQVGTENDWVEIYAGYGFCFAIKSNGTLWGWGSSDVGQLATTSGVNYLVPTQIGTDTNWKSVSSSSSSVAAIKTDGTLWTWGNNSFGQLGNGTAANVAFIQPAQIGTDTDWRAVEGGGGFAFSPTDHFVALKQNGELFAWGDNSNGKLGINSTQSVNEPTTVCNTVGIKELAQQDILFVYPNPAISEINVQSDENIESLNLMDLFGNIVLNEKNKTRLDITHISSGSYVLSVNFTNKKIQKTIVIIR